MALTAQPAPARAGALYPFALTTSVVREGTRTVVALGGEADFSNRSILADALSQVIAWEAGDVVVDLADLGFIDTANVRLFGVATQLLDGLGRKMTFRAPSRLVTRMLGFFGLTELIEATSGTD